MNIKKIIASILLLAATSSVFAVTVNFGPGQSNGSFSCTMDNPNATVSIDTHGLDARGFCSGPYVSAPGHLVNVPANIINTYYFEIKKSLGSMASVDVTQSSGNITCAAGHDGGILWGDGQDYCVVKK